MEQIQKIAEARTETLIVEVGNLNNDSRLYVRESYKNVYTAWTITTQAQHDYMINKIDNSKNRVSELGEIYLDMIK